jgi:hypothetical protein
MVVMYWGLSRLDSKRLRSIHGYATMRQTKHTRVSAFAPNHLELIDELNAARQVNEYLLETGAEQAIWEPWLILDYASTGT